MARMCKNNFLNHFIDFCTQANKPSGMLDLSIATEFLL